MNARNANLARLARLARTDDAARAALLVALARNNDLAAYLKALSPRFIHRIAFNAFLAHLDADRAFDSGLVIDLADLVDALGGDSAFILRTLQNRMDPRRVTGFRITNIKRALNRADRARRAA